MLRSSGEAIKVHDFNALFPMNMNSIYAIKNTNELCRRLEYTFKEKDLLDEAFQHSSYVNEHPNSGLSDNERLEFLGDAVLELAISHIIMDLYPEAKEGDLSKYRARVVNERGLFLIARELELGNYLLLGKGEELSNGRTKLSILANTMEALLGALYLDAGFDKTKEIIQSLFLPYIGKINSRKVVNDFKSLLQEYTQETYKTRPKYFTVEENGPAHDRTFRVAISIKEKIMAEGEGKSKKEAEQKAAREAFFCLKENREDI